jgi:hypothetical protein
MTDNRQDETNTNVPREGATFAVDEKRRSGDDIPDPDTTLNQPTTTGASNAGTTGADVAHINDDLGAVDTGERGQGSGFGQVDLDTTSLFASDRGPAGAGPVEGSASGATAPRLEMTDIGLVDLNVVDIRELAEPTDAPDIPSDIEDEETVASVSSEDIDEESASTENDAGVMQDADLTQDIDHTS